MAMLPYLRVPSWKPAHALRKIAEKAETYRNRLQAVLSEEAALAAEKLEIQANLRILEVEHARESERVRQRSPSPVTENLPLDKPVSEGGLQGIVVPVVEEVKADFDRSLRVFRSRGALRGDARSSKAIIPVADEPKPIIVRLVRLVATPGLIHTSLIGEAAQRQFGDVFPVPPESCSASLAPPLVDDTLSMAVLQDLVKPERAGRVLVLLLGEASTRGDGEGPGPID